jgi:hypothetical protein
MQVLLPAAPGGLPGWLSAGVLFCAAPGVPPAPLVVPVTVPSWFLMIRMLGGGVSPEGVRGGTLTLPHPSACDGGDAAAGSVRNAPAGRLPDAGCCWAIDTEGVVVAGGCCCRGGVLPSPCGSTHLSSVVPIVLVVLPPALPLASTTLLVCCPSDGSSQSESEGVRERVTSVAGHSTSRATAAARESTAMPQQRRRLGVRVGAPVRLLRMELPPAALRVLGVLTAGLFVLG